MNSKKTVIYETEPIFSLHIDFPDGSNPVDYHNLNLKQTTVVLAEWSEKWILSPDADCKLNGAVWNWHARARGRSLIDLFADLDQEAGPDEYDEVEPILEDSLNKEE